MVRCKLSSRQGDDADAGRSCCANDPCGLFHCGGRGQHVIEQSDDLRQGVNSPELLKLGDVVHQ